MADPRIRIILGTFGIPNVNRDLDGLMRRVRFVAAAAGAALVAGFATRKIVQGINEASKAINALGDTAQKLGATTEGLSALRYGASQVGVESKKLDLGLQRMTRRIAEAATGAGEARGAIAELGLSAKELAALRPEDQFLEIARAMGDVGSQSDRVRLSFKLFDSEGVDLVRLLGEGEEGIARFREEAERMGLVISGETARAADAFRDRVERLRLTSTGLWWTMAGQLLPSLARLADALVVLVEAGGPLRDLWFLVGEGIRAAVDEMTEFAVKTSTTVASLSTFVRTLKDTRSITQSLQLAGIESMRVEWQMRQRFARLGAPGATGGGDKGPTAAEISAQISGQARYFGFLAKTADTDARRLQLLALQRGELQAMIDLREEEFAAAAEASTNAEGQILLTQEFLTAQEAVIKAREAELQISKEIETVEDRIRAAKEQAGARSFLGTFGGQLGLQSAAMFSQLGTAAANAAGIVTSTLGTAFSSISEQIKGLIRGTTSWSEALSNIGSAVLDQLLASFAQFFVAMGARALLSALFGAAMTKAAAASAAAAWAGPAILANTATYGAASAIGLSTTLASMAGAPLVTAASLAGQAPGFATGGLISGAEQLIRVNEAGPEFVVNAAATRRNLEDLRAINAGGSASSPRGGKTVVNVLFDRRQLRKLVLEDITGSHQLVDTLADRRIEIGGA